MRITWDICQTYRFPGPISDKQNLNLQRGGGHPRCCLCPDKFMLGRWALWSRPALTSFLPLMMILRHNYLWVIDRNKIKGSGFSQNSSEGTKIKQSERLPRSWSALEKLRSKTNLIVYLAQTPLYMSLLCLCCCPPFSRYDLAQCWSLPYVECPQSLLKAQYPILPSLSPFLSPIKLFSTLSA